MHSCEPNCCIAFAANSMVAIRPIEAGETITRDYEATETWFNHPFWCRCGSRRCRGRIG
jgi:SET domain-containing protein